MEESQLFYISWLDGSIINNITYDPEELYIFGLGIHLHDFNLN